VSHICSVSDECAMRLDQIEEQIEEASGIEGVRLLRFRLGECLQKLRDETRRQRDEMSQGLARLQKQVDAAQSGDDDSVVLAPELDKLTGLEPRESAEEAIVAAIERGGVSYAALFVVARLHLINAQFGYATGDRILREVSAHLQSAVLAGDRLFRWTGPAFLAILDRTEPPAEVEAELQRIAGSALEAAVQIGNGCVRLPILRTSLILPLGGTGGVADLTRRLDAFTGLQSRH